jgi:hypothetical protein
MGKIKVEFTQKYAGYKKGDTAEVHRMLASSLINERKVAKIYVKKTEK